MLYGGANRGLWEGSHQLIFPRTVSALTLVLWVNHSSPHPLQDTLQGSSRQVWFSLLWDHNSFPGSWWAKDFVCPPRVESLFSTVLWKSCDQIPLAFKVWFSGDSCSHCWILSMGGLTWVSEPLLQWENFCGIILRFCGLSTWQLQDLILLWLCPFYCLIVASPYSLDVGYHFWCIPQSSCCSAISCDFSTLYKWTHVLLFCHLEPISSSICILIGVFRPFAFNVIIDVIRFVCHIFIDLLSLEDPAPCCFSPFYVSILFALLLAINFYFTFLVVVVKVCSIHL